MSRSPPPLSTSPVHDPSLSTQYSEEDLPPSRWKGKGRETLDSKPDDGEADLAERPSSAEPLHTEFGGAQRADSYPPADDDALEERRIQEVSNNTSSPRHADFT